MTQRDEGHNFRDSKNKAIEYERKQAREKEKRTAHYEFEVPCSYYYCIEAESEEQARKILIEKGGLDIEGELCIEEKNYRNAILL
tara:strand:- start:4 stop:258 length:255 start_codon:yes stop_codon:yes gene_type:complete